MLAKIHVTLKSGVLDPQGRAVLMTLKNLGHQEVDDVRIGKYIELSLPGLDSDSADKKVQEMCEGLLANTVIESYRYTLEPLNQA